MYPNMSYFPPLTQLEPLMFLYGLGNLFCCPSARLLFLLPARSGQANFFAARPGPTRTKLFLPDPARLFFCCPARPGI